MLTKICISGRKQLIGHLIRTHTFSQPHQCGKKGNLHGELGHGRLQNVYLSIHSFACSAIFILGKHFSKLKCQSQTPIFLWYPHPHTTYTCMRMHTDTRAHTYTHPSVSSPKHVHKLLYNLPCTHQSYCDLSFKSQLMQHFLRKCS